MTDSRTLAPGARPSGQTLATLMIAVAAIFFLTLLASAAYAAAPAVADTAGVEAVQSDEGTQSSYKLAPGDVITIRVFGEDDLSKEKIRLSDAGTIPYPVLGEVRARGFTIGEIEREITAGLKGRYLVNPQVSVHVDEYRPFYINGMVEKPGSYPFQPGLTIIKASAIAGGFKERASMSKIYIIREGDPAQKPQKADLSTVVNPGDTISVQDSFF